MVAGPAEGHGLAFAGGVGDWGDTGFGGQVRVAVEALAHAAELGQDLRGTDLSGSREAHQQAAFGSRLA